ncbi:glycosyltransferase [Noviherbaspirillum sp.]|uniref:glycosyltransferase n=1 Tax=Noviherbaspirillum sp. TaxID=1926288 RepID=UPI002FE1EC42
MEKALSRPHHTQTPKVAYVHEWLTEWGGSEDVVRAMLRALPSDDLYATVDFMSDKNRRSLGGVKPRTTFIQRLPWARKRFWNYLPLTPLAIETLDLSAAQIIISSSHAFAKGVLTTASQLHVSYVHSPMRYAWDLHHQYLTDYGLNTGFRGVVARYVFHRLRQWDRQTANNVDLFLANSRHVQARIWRTYRRPARVLYPPVRTDIWRLETHKEDHYVTVSRLVSYKRIDLLVEAFRLMPKRKLIVIGDGPEFPRLARNRPANVELLGWQPDAVIQEHVGSARAFLFAAHEDFGISPVEAQACGTPVIAYGVGGAVETVRNVGVAAHPTGLHFMRQSVEAVIAGIEAFDEVRNQVDPFDCHAWAQNFSEDRFATAFKEIIQDAWDVWRRDPAAVDLQVATASGNLKEGQ